jgi:hypothetical protein
MWDHQGGALWRGSVHELWLTGESIAFRKLFPFTFFTKAFSITLSGYLSLAKKRLVHHETFSQGR